MFWDFIEKNILSHKCLKNLIMLQTAEKTKLSAMKNAVLQDVFKNLFIKACNFIPKKSGFAVIAKADPT